MQFTGLGIGGMEDRDATRSVRLDLNPTAHFKFGQVIFDRRGVKKAGVADFPNGRRSTILLDVLTKEIKDLLRCIAHGLGIAFPAMTAYGMRKIESLRGYRCWIVMRPVWLR
jgi:hypothetical protein